MKRKIRQPRKRLAGRQCGIIGRAGGQIGDDLQGRRRVGRGIRHIREAHREPVHRRIVEDRDVDGRPHTGAQRETVRGAERDMFRGERLDGREHVGEMLLDAAQGAHARTAAGSRFHASMPPARTDASTPAARRAAAARCARIPTWKNPV